jgi:hypothetical protein
VAWTVAVFIALLPMVPGHAAKRVACDYRDLYHHHTRLPSVNRGLTVIGVPGRPGMGCAGRILAAQGRVALAVIAHRRAAFRQVN